jgi:hypothetical protein
LQADDVIMADAAEGSAGVEPAADGAVLVSTPTQTTIMCTRNFACRATLRSARTAGWFTVHVLLDGPLSDKFMATFQVQVFEDAKTSLKGKFLRFPAGFRTSLQKAPRQKDIVGVTMKVIAANQDGSNERELFSVGVTIKVPPRKSSDCGAFIAPQLMHAVKDAFEEGTSLRLCYFWEAAMKMLTVKVTGIPRSAEGGAIGQAVGGVVEATSDHDSDNGDSDNETLAQAAAASGKWRL